MQQIVYYQRCFSPDAFCFSVRKLSLILHLGYDDALHFAEAAMAHQYSFTSFVMINDGSECTFLCLLLLPQTDFRVVFSFPKNNHKDKITKMSTRASAEKNVQSL